VIGEKLIIHHNTQQSVRKQDSRAMARKFSRNRNLSAAPMTVACEAIGVHENTLRTWAKAGKIKHFRTVGGQYRYDVLAYLAAQDETPDDGLSVGREKP
jgi:excisionase family DNA binding protein